VAQLAEEFFVFCEPRAQKKEQSSVETISAVP
jgi:hypothetical protein